MNNNIWLKMNPNTHQRSEPNPRFEELDQFHQDLPRSLSFDRYFSDPCTDLCAVIGMIFTIIISICACIWLISVSTCNALKSLALTNRTLELSLVNFTNNSLLLNDTF